MTIPNETCPVCGGECIRIWNEVSTYQSIDHSKELAEALENLLHRVELNDGLGFYKGGPIFVIRKAKDALTNYRKRRAG